MRRSELNLEGLNCPMYVIQCKAALTRLDIGQQLRVTISDRDCSRDIPKLAVTEGCEVMEQSGQDGVFVFLIEKVCDDENRSGRARKSLQPRSSGQFLQFHSVCPA